MEPLEQSITTCTCTGSKDHNEASSLTLLNDHACKWCDCDCRTGVVASMLFRIEKIIVHHLIELTNFPDVLKMEQFIFSLQVFNNLTDFKYCFSFLSSLNFFFFSILPKKSLSCEYEKLCSLPESSVHQWDAAYTVIFYLFWDLSAACQGCVKSVNLPDLCRPAGLEQQWIGV